MPDDTARAALLRLLESGPSDQRVRDRLTLLDRLQAARDKGDVQKEVEVGWKLAAAAKAIQSVESEQRGAMIAAMERAQRRSDDESRVSLLVEAFETCALVQVVAEDDFGDHQSVERAIEHKHAIAAALDRIATGRRSALSRLLDSPFAGVRASAAAHLLNAGLMWDRVVPLLQRIEREVFGSAGWTAFWALAPDHHGSWLTGDAPDNRLS